MLTKPTISLRLADKTNSELLAFAQSVSSSMSGNPSYASPVNPTLLELADLITDYSDALTAYGVDPHNKGSHVQKLAVDSTRAALEAGLTGLAYYASNTTPYDEAAFASGGFDVRPENVPVGPLPAVVGLRQFLSIEVNFGEAKLRWSRPLGIKQGDVKAYNVYRNTTASFGTASLIATVTKTTITDSGLSNPHYYYWVVPINSAGAGVTSDICLAFVQVQPA